MWEFAKKSIAFGIGAAMLTGEKLKQIVDEAVEHGEMTSEEGKSFIDDVTKRADDEKRNLQGWVHDQIAKKMHEMGAVDVSRVEALERRVRALEMRITQVEEIQTEEVGEIIE